LARLLGRLPARPEHVLSGRDGHAAVDGLADPGRQRPRRPEPDRPHLPSPARAHLGCQRVPGGGCTRDHRTVAGARMMSASASAGGDGPPDFGRVARAVTRDATSRDGRGARPTSEQVATEEPLEIRVNGASLAVVMRTPGDDLALASGLLFT